MYEQEVGGAYEQNSLWSIHGDVGVMGGSYTVPCRAQGSPWPLPGLRAQRGSFTLGIPPGQEQRQHTLYIVLPPSEFWTQNPHFRKLSMVVYAFGPNPKDAETTESLAFPEQTAELNQQAPGQWGDSPRPRRRWQFLGNDTSSCPLATTRTHMFTCAHRHVQREKLVVTGQLWGMLPTGGTRAHLSQMPVFLGVVLVIVHLHFTW